MASGGGGGGGVGKMAVRSGLGSVVTVAPGGDGAGAMPASLSLHGIPQEHSGAVSPWMVRFNWAACALP